MTLPAAVVDAVRLLSPVNPIVASCRNGMLSFSCLGILLKQGVVQQQIVDGTFTLCNGCVLVQAWLKGMGSKTVATRQGWLRFMFLLLSWGH